ncbi:MAG: hypothetical protein KatS3mg095_0157 [Candidatus Parcubacteria bacterium]|nr:MAG: hypothetical protein KatS3mg095_0157 [Candidatus Parcubacteria bacterium]
MIIGHSEQIKVINNILSSYDKGLFLLIGPEAVGKFHLIKNLTFEYRPLIFDSLDNILRINTSEIIQKMLLLSTRNDKQIIIVNDAHKFNKEAQNKLLKIFEEIPNKSLIFLITHKQFKILSTIRSRSQKIKFSLVDNEQIKKFLTNQNYSVIDVDFALKLFPGQIGKIIRLINNKEKLKIIKNIFLSNSDVFEKFILFFKIEKDITLEEAIIYFLIYERYNLLKKNEDSIKKIKYLLNLYEDSSFFLNKELQFSNILLNINGKSL